MATSVNPSAAIGEHRWQSAAPAGRLGTLRRGADCPPADGKHIQGGTSGNHMHMHMTYMHMPGNARPLGRTCRLRTESVIEERTAEVVVCSSRPASER